MRGTLHRVWYPDFRNTWSEGGGVDRVLNGLNVLRGIGSGVVCVVLGIGAIALSGWLSWIGGSVLLAVALYGFPGPLLWPKSRLRLLPDMTLPRRSLLLVAFVVVAWLLIVGFADLFAGCGGGELGATPTGPAVKAPVCFEKGLPRGGQPGGRAGTVGACSSPDGAWRVTLKNGVGGWACALYVTRLSTGRRVRMYGSHQDGCSYLAWAKPKDLLLFDSNADLHTLNPFTRKVIEAAAFGEFVVSPNRHWVAGNAVPGPEAPQETVFALTPSNSKCVIVPRGSNRTDEVVGFTRDS